MSQGMNIKQEADYVVIRSPGAEIRSKYLSTPVICNICKNKRKWKIRCEFCGHMLKVEDNGNE